MRTLPATFTLAAMMPVVARAAEYRDEVFVSDTKTGETVLGATATNEGGKRQTIHVRTRDGQDITVGDLEPGESARVTVIERPGAAPLILFDRK